MATRTSSRRGLDLDAPECRNETAPVPGSKPTPACCIYLENNFTFAEIDISVLHTTFNPVHRMA